MLVGGLDCQRSLDAVSSALTRTHIRVHTCVRACALACAILTFAPGLYDRRLLLQKCLVKKRHLKYKARLQLTVRK